MLKRWFNARSKNATIEGSKRQNSTNKKTFHTSSTVWNVHSAGQTQHQLTSTTKYFDISQKDVGLVIFKTR